MNRTREMILIFKGRTRKSRIRRKLSTISNRNHQLKQEVIQKKMKTVMEMRLLENSMMKKGISGGSLRLMTMRAAAATSQEMAKRVARPRTRMEETRMRIQLFGMRMLIFVTGRWQTRRMWGVGLPLTKWTGILCLLWIYWPSLAACVRAIKSYIRLRFIQATLA